jgi:MtN3 and saliva related transmembrane protein
MMNEIEILGFVAGILVAISVVPQVIKSRKTRSTKDVSLARSAINIAGQITWIIYGFYIHSYSLVIMSSITLIMNLFMITLKLKFG